MNKNNICVFDFETSDINTDTLQILQIGSLILDPISLDIIDTFNVLVKYEDWNTVSEKALAVNKLTKEKLDTEGIDIKIAWKDFCSFINKYNRDGSIYNRPIMAGQNIMTFDLPILNRYCQRFGPFDKQQNKNSLFYPFAFIDTITLFFSWFEHESRPGKLGLTTIAEHMGFSKTELESAHDALTDCKLVAKILKRFLLFQRNIMKKYKNKIKGCFANEIL
ncbi:MAG: 3'-5' exonuclease [Methanogenium sp.]|jgi:DNA polymerase III epsilon subunit-like protein